MIPGGQPEFKGFSIGISIGIGIHVVVIVIIASVCMNIMSSAAWVLFIHS